MEKKKTYTIIMVGDSGIGKTTLASVFVEGKSEFSDIYITTSGAELRKKFITIDGEQILLKIWDLSGANEYRTRIAYQFKDMDGVLLCYSATSEESWTHLDHWREMIECQIGKNEFNNLEKLIVGLKYDSSSKSVKDEEVVLKAQSLQNTDVLLTSSKNYRNVQEAFYSIAERIHYKKYPISQSPTMSNSKNATKPQKTSRCFIL